MKAASDEQRAAVMAKLRHEGRLGDGGQVRLVPLSRAAPAPRPKQPPARRAAAKKSPATQDPEEARAQPWGMAGLLQLFDSAGVPREAVDKLLKDYRGGYLYHEKQHLGPLLLHSPFVRAALERGEDVPREILELHPHLLPEADLLHGAEPEGRDAALLKEAHALGWIGYNDSRTAFHPDARWWYGSPPSGYDHRNKGGRTAMDALKMAWNGWIRHHGVAPVVDEGGPWTLAEQRQRLDAEKARLSKRYAALGLKAPRVPLHDEIIIWDRESRLARSQDIQAGLPDEHRRVRENLRDANKHALSRQQELDEARFWQALPPDDPERPRRHDGEPHTSWRNDNLRAALERVTYSEPEHIRAVLADEAFTAGLEPYVLQRLKKHMAEKGASS